MKLDRNGRENGQVLIILVVGLIGLLGITALAIDGGMMFSDRRHAQNAADAAALAGAYAVAHDPGSGLTLDEIEANIVRPPAIARAAGNDFTNGGDTTVVVNYPPDSGTYAGNPLYVQAIISAKVNTSLIHLVYKGEVRNTVEAVAHFIPATVAPLYNGNGLISLAPHECPGLSANGTFNAILTMGGIFVNSDCNPAVEGNSNSKTIDAPSLSSVGTIDPSFLNKGTIDIQSINQPAQQFPYPPGIDMVPPPDCATAPDAIYDASAKKWSPPSEGGTAKIPGGLDKHFVGELAPGVYCIPNSGFTFDAGADITAHGVTLFITGTHSCDFTWNGGATFHLSAPPKTTTGGVPDCKGDTCNYKGIIVYVDPNNFNTWPDTKDTVIDGHAGSEIRGTFYAPTCNFKKTGTEDMKFVGQIIGYTFQNIGTATLKLDYNSDDAGDGVTPAYVDLSK